MPNIVPIEYPGLDNILANIDFYKQKFKDDSIIVFRNANLTNDEQETVIRSMGDYFGWYPNTTVGIMERYTENHSHNNKVIGSGKDEIILTWHIEHVYFDIPIAVGAWNMLKFNEDSENGKTYFVDTAKIYDSLPKDWQEFLDKSVSYAYDYNYRKEMREAKVVKQHWANDEKVIRFEIEKYNDINHLKSFDGRPPTTQEKIKFLEICRHIYKEINDNLDNRLVHKWQVGDLVILDIFKLAHAVTGGFNPANREFTGLWLYAEDNSNSVK